MTTAPQQKEQVQPTGVFPSQALVRLIHSGVLRADEPFTDDQIQPASIDLRLGAKAYRVRASFLPGRACTVQERLKVLSMHEFDLSEGAVLEKDCVYIVPLLENVQLDNDISAVGNPKSSTGRLDVAAAVPAVQADVLFRAGEAMERR